MKQQYIDLAERCEAAEAGSRELDIRIAVAVKWDLEYSMAPFANLVEKFGMGWAIETASEYNSAYRSLPHYTTSLDAAMTLANGLSESQIWSAWQTALKLCSVNSLKIATHLPRFLTAAICRAMGEG